MSEKENIFGEKIDAEIGGVEIEDEPQKTKAEDKAKDDSQAPLFASKQSDPLEKSMSTASTIALVSVLLQMANIFLGISNDKNGQLVPVIATLSAYVVIIILLEIYFLSLPFRKNKRKIRNSDFYLKLFSVILEIIVPIACIVPLGFALVANGSSCRGDGLRCLGDGFRSFFFNIFWFFIACPVICVPTIVYDIVALFMIRRKLLETTAPAPKNANSEEKK